MRMRVPRINITQACTVFLSFLGTIHVVDIATCVEVDCLAEEGSVHRIDVAQDEENRVLASQVVQTRVDGSTVNKVTVFSQTDGTWDRLLLARETPVRHKIGFA